MDSFAKEVKTIITGVLVSSKLQLTMKQLDQGFYEQEGYYIPFSKLGFSNLEQYLWSLRDSVRVLGQGEHARVVAISEKSAHVLELVAKQKFSSRQKPMRRYPRYCSPQFAPQTYNTNGCYYNSRPRTFYNSNVDTGCNNSIKPLMSVSPLPYIPQFETSQEKTKNTSPCFAFNKKQNYSTLDQNFKEPDEPAKTAFSVGPATNQNGSMCTPNFKYDVPATTPNTPQEKTSSFKSTLNLPKVEEKSPTSSYFFSDDNASWNRNGLDTTLNSESSYHSLIVEPSNKSTVVHEMSYKPTGQNAKTYFGTNVKHAMKNHERLSDLASKEIVETEEYSTLPTLSVNQGSSIKDWPVVRTNDTSPTLSEDEVFYSDDEDINTRIPRTVQENLRKLVTRCPDGIWCAKIPDIYRKEFGSDLEYAKYGYISLTHMCMDLRNAFHYVQPDHGDCKLYDKHRPITYDIFNGIRRSEYLKIKADAEETTESALPETGVKELLQNMHESSTPIDIVTFGEFIERQWINSMDQEKDFIDVNVAEIYDPSKFWLNLKRCGTQLNKLMDNMQAFYQANAKAFEIPHFALRVGLYISTIFLDEYHRAVIVDVSLVNSKGLVKAFFIDYGTVSLISSTGVYYLQLDFGRLPAQGIRARLTGVYPPHQNEQWSREASGRFLSWVINKDLVAQIRKIDTKREALEIILADTSDNEDFYINDALVFEGYARFTHQEHLEAKPSDYVPIVKYIHLFPTFDELENGAVPTATEMIVFDNARVGIERIYPQYFTKLDSSKPVASDNDRSSGKFDYDAAERRYHNVSSHDDDSSYTDSLCTPELKDEDSPANKTIESESIYVSVNTSIEPEDSIPLLEPDGDDDAIVEIISPVKSLTLNPEKEPFVPKSLKPPISQVKEISVETITQVRRPPPGFNNIQPVPIKEGHLMNYINSPQDNYFSQTLNFNPVQGNYMLTNNPYVPPPYYPNPQYTPLELVALEKLYHQQGFVPNLPPFLLTNHVPLFRPYYINHNITNVMNFQQNHEAITVDLAAKCMETPQDVIAKQEILGDNKSSGNVETKPEEQGDDTKRDAVIIGEVVPVPEELQTSTGDSAETKPEEQSDDTKRDAVIIGEVVPVLEELQTSTDDSAETSTFIKEDRVPVSSRSVTKHVLGDKKVHVITHREVHYFLLDEITFNLLGNSLSIVQIRKMFIGTEHSVSVVDINLKKYPELKGELVELDLIKSTASTVNVIPVYYVRKFVTILTSDKTQLNDFTEFLSDTVKLWPTSSLES